MKSVGEAMGIGRTFKEALNKTLRSLENNWSGFHANGNSPYHGMSSEALADDLRWGTPDRILKIWQALTIGISSEQISTITGIDIWFLKNLQQLVEFEYHIVEEFKERQTLTADTLRSAKRL
jgi:carbamoyl-phosphate synthase large subunit